MSARKPGLLGLGRCLRYRCICCLASFKLSWRVPRRFRHEARDGSSRCAPQFDLVRRMSACLVGVVVAAF
jgi:hypothetical protein